MALAHGTVFTTNGRLSEGPLDPFPSWWLGSAVSSRFRLVVVGAMLIASHAASAEPPARDRAKALLAELDKTGASRGAARDAVAEAGRALGRADKARLAGDQKHGTELEELALEWAEAARDIERAAAAEARAAELEKKLTEAEAKLRTTRTLIEQAAARRARADAELAELEQSKAGPPAASTSGAPSPSKAPKSAPSAAPPAKSAPPAAAPAKSAPPAVPAPPAKPKEPK